MIRVTSFKMYLFLKLLVYMSGTMNHISKGIICTLYETYVQSALLYAYETWALPEQQLHRLEVCQIEGLRKSSKVSLKDRTVLL